MKPPRLTAEEQALAESFAKLFYSRGPLLGGGTWARTFWFGSRVLKCPLDLWLYQDIIGQLQPELIIECGTGDGGSALYFASLCSLVGCGQVLTIDVKPATYNDPHPRVFRVVGPSSVDPAIVKKATVLATQSKTMVVLDSDHSYEHVSAELKAYAPLVSPGCHLVIEDTNVEETKQAALDFLAANSSDFEIDDECDKYLITFNTWLRRKTP